MTGEGPPHAERRTCVCLRARESNRIHEQIQLRLCQAPPFVFLIFSPPIGRARTLGVMRRSLA